MSDLLRNKIFGCIAGAYIGSSMGAVTEGLSAQEIQEKYGYVNELLPLVDSAQFSNRTMPAGTIEDGIERQKFMCLAILDKKDRVTINDVAQAIIKYGEDEKLRVSCSQFDIELNLLAKAGVLPRQIGTYQSIADLVAFPRSCHPIGLVNACDPQQAAQDAFEVGSLYGPDNIHENGLEWGAVVCAAIAEACKPDATLESVIEAGRKYCKRILYPETNPNVPISEECVAISSVFELIGKIDKAIEIAKSSTDEVDLREKLDSAFGLYGNVTYSISRSPEIVCRSLAIFYFCKGDLKRTIEISVNMGRDTDCTAAIASGLSGAFSGGTNLPQKWIDTVDEATKIYSFTVVKWTMRELSDRLYDVVMARAEKMERVIKDIRRE